MVLVAATVHPIEALTRSGGSWVGAVEDATTRPHGLGPCSTFRDILPAKALLLVIHHSASYGLGIKELRDIPINDVVRRCPLI
jgi:hypothetical protein